MLHFINAVFINAVVCNALRVQYPLGASGVEHTLCPGKVMGGRGWEILCMSILLPDMFWSKR